MNRKLLNGLLVLAVAAGGVGTFTSCKDEDFRSNVDYELDSLQAQINAIRGVTDDAFKKNLQDWLDYQTEQNSAPYGWTYAEMVQAVAALQTVYDNVVAGNYDEVKDFVDGLYKMMFENIFPGEDWFRQIWLNQTQLENLLGRASSVSVSRTYNPVFGTINLPIGLKTTVLATYVYKAQSAVNFPGIDMSNLAAASYSNATTLSTIAAIADSEELVANKVAFTMSADEQFGNMGGAIVTINPSSVDFTGDNYKVELVKSTGEVALSSEDEGLALSAFDGELYFGSSRADNNGLYALAASASADNYGDFEIDLEKSEIKDAFNQAISDKTVSNFAHLGEVVFDAINNKVPAYAVKLSWTENEPVEGEFNEDGTPVTQEVENSVLSDFDLAAVAAHPLSYNLMLSNKIPSGKSLPILSPLTEYLDRIGNKLNIEFDKAEGVDPITIYIGVTEKDGKLYVVFYKDEEMTEPVGEPYEYSNGLNMTADDLQSLATALVGNYNNSVVNSDVIEKINDSIESINDALANVEGKVDDFKDYLQKAKDSKALTYAQKLVDIYNEVAEKVNNFLADPNHYLQVMAVYSATDGAHHLSTVYGDPVRFNSAKGDGFEIFATSYNGEVIVPSYKKYVAITAVDNKPVTKATSANYNGGENAEFLNTVLPGQTQRIPVKITSAMKGHTLTITYLSVDYRGKCSMQDYYVYVY